MNLYENWISMAYDRNGQSLKPFWKSYTPKETTIYRSILAEKTTALSGTISELAEKYQFEPVHFCGFLDGIHGACDGEFDAESADENTQINLTVDFGRLYRKMVEYKAEHLYTLSEWDGIFSPEEQKEMFAVQKKSGTFVRETKVGRNDLCPCGSGKKYKFCCENE